MPSWLSPWVKSLHDGMGSECTTFHNTGMNITTRQFSLAQLFLLGFLLLLLLRIGSGLLLFILAHLQPTLSPAWGAITSAVPLPILILVFPFLLALIIILLSRPRKSRFQTTPPEAVSTPAPTDFAQTLFAPVYSWAHVKRVLTIIGVIWLVLFITQLVFWFAFRSYQAVLPIF